MYGEFLRLRHWSYRRSRWWFVRGASDFRSRQLILTKHAIIASEYQEGKSSRLHAWSPGAGFAKTGQSGGVQQ